MNVLQLNSTVLLNSTMSSFVDLFHNNCDNGDDPLKDVDKLTPHEHSVFIVSIVVCCINMIGNTAVLILICQRRLLGRTTNVFVFSIAMADTVCCVGAIPYNVYLVLGLDMSVYLCKAYFYLLCVSRTTVSYTLVLLTTEKVMNIIKPSRFITAGRCMFFISLLWFFASAYNVWTVVFYTIYKEHTFTEMELLMDPSKGMYGRRCFYSHRFDTLQDIFLVLDLLVLYVLPMSVLTSQFVIIVRKIQGTVKQRFETYCYIMRFLIFMFIVYVICHSPFEIATVLKNKDRKVTNTVSDVYATTNLLYHCRGIFNLLIYVYFKQYVCRRRRRLSTAASCKVQLELPTRRHHRGLSINETRLTRI